MYNFLNNEKLLTGYEGNILFVGPEDGNVDLVRGHWIKYVEIFSFIRAALQLMNELNLRTYCSIINYH